MLGIFLATILINVSFKVCDVLIAALTTQPPPFLHPPLLKKKRNAALKVMRPCGGKLRSPSESKKKTQHHSGDVTCVIYGCLAGFGHLP
jgi:hypothetical protein